MTDCPGAPSTAPTAGAVLRPSPPSVCLAGRTALKAPRAQLYASVALLRSVTGIEVRRHVGILHLPATCTRQQRLHFLGETLHLVFDFGPFKTARLEPGMEHKIVVTTVLLDLHDLGAHVGRRAEKCDLLLQQRVGADLLVQVYRRLALFREYRGEAERAVVVPLQFETRTEAFELALRIAAGQQQVNVARGGDPATLLRIPSVLGAPAVQPIRPSMLFGFLEVKLDVLAQTRSDFCDEVTVDTALRRPFDRTLGRKRFPYLRMWLLERLRKHLQFTKDRCTLRHRIRTAVRIGSANLQYLVETPPCFRHVEVGHRLLVMPPREDRRDRIELPLVRERRQRPRLDNDLVGLLVEGAVTFLVLDRRKRPAEHLGLARLVAAADSELETASAYDIEHRRLLSDPNRMPPRRDVCCLAEPDSAGACRNRGFGQQRIRAEFGALGLEVMLGHEEVVEAEPVGENSLPNLIYQRPLAALVNLGERAVINHHAFGRGDSRQIARSVVKDAYLQHVFTPCPAMCSAADDPSFCLHFVTLQSFHHRRRIPRRSRTTLRSPETGRHS